MERFFSARDGKIIFPFEKPARGWYCNIDVEETKLEGKYFAPISENRSESDWIHCEIKNEQFYSFGGPQNLIEILTVFRKWNEEVDSSRF